MTLCDVLLIRLTLFVILRLAAFPVRELPLIAVTGLDGGSRLAYRALHLRDLPRMESIVGLLVSIWAEWLPIPLTPSHLGGLRHDDRRGGLSTGSRDS